MCDGGRYQHLDRSVGPSGRRSARKGEHWKESRIGLLVSMSGEQHESDPQPTLPPELRHEAMADKLSEIGKTGAQLDSPEATAASEETSTIASDGLVGATLEHRGVVASRQNWEAFGPLLASRAWYRGLAAARAINADEASAQRQYDSWAAKI